MKFIFADSIDTVDPGYDFIRDRNAEGRTAHWDDQYPHEILDRPPYDGILVSRHILGGKSGSGKYSRAQAMRFRRSGARKFLRLDTPQFRNFPIFGDCGAFAYHKEERPPYTPDEMVEFYDDAGFTHGCSVDHIIFDFDEKPTGLKGGSEEARRRFDITIENAARFLKVSKRLSKRFTPLGVIQGWSPASMGHAAKRLCKMGYSYLALGGTVPLKTDQIKACLCAIRDAIPPKTKLHILGFAKADDIEGFRSFGITSFDTTSPLIRAFKDGKANYYLPGPPGKGLNYYTAIRVPQALENPKLMNLVKRGIVNQEKLVKLEKSAMTALRAYDRDEVSLDEALQKTLSYATLVTLGAPAEALPGSKSAAELRARYYRTLLDRPWKRCSCAICQKIGIEVIIFRASNRNKRRGIHNLGIYKRVVDGLSKKTEVGEAAPDLFSDTSRAKPIPHDSVFRCEGG
jgi:hypothetical protein